MLDTLSDDALLDLLFTEEDRLARAAVDELLRRGPRIAPRLVDLIDDDALWDSADWSPIHATFVVAAMKPPDALDAVLRSLERAARFDEPHLIDVADSMLASFGPDAVPALIAAFAGATSYPRIWINSALAHLAGAHPATRDVVRGHLRSVALGTGGREVCACAAWDLLPFVTPADRETLEILRDRNLIDAADVEDALAGSAEPPFSKPVDWLRFYDPESLAKRDQDFEGHEHEADEPDPDDILPPDPSREMLSRLEEPSGAPAPIVNAAPKVGRNDPCPCGSGRKFKKCCDP